jgi:hypothetical protein
MSSGFLSKMFKQEIPTNAIEFDYYSKKMYDVIVNKGP